MTDPFPEVLFHYWHTPHSTTDCSWSVLCWTEYNATLGRSDVGKQDGRGCPDEHWDQTLMLTITGREAGDREGRARAKWSWIHRRAPGELPPDSWGDGAVSKVDLLGMWRVLLHGAVRTFQPGDQMGERLRRWEQGELCMVCLFKIKYWLLNHCTPWKTAQITWFFNKGPI